MKFIDRFKNWMVKNNIEDSVEEIKEEERPASHPQTSLNIRTTAIYPKTINHSDGERERPYASPPRSTFKFPLIPDDQSGEGHIRKPQQNKEVNQVFLPRTSQQRPRIEPDEKSKPVSKNKRKFRPTQVISPIYGYNRPQPPEPKQEAIAEVPAVPEAPRELRKEVPIPIESGTPFTIANPVPEVAEKERIETPVYTQTQVVVLEEERKPILLQPLPVAKIVEEVPQGLPKIPTHSSSYHRPYGGLLKPVPPIRQESTESVLRQQEILAETLRNFHVNAEVIGAVQGPSVTRYEIQPAAGVKVNKVTNLADDLKLSLAARDIRIEAPIPGRSAIGIEVPNEKCRPVHLREIIESEPFRRNPSFLTVALGVDISGKPMVADLSTMPHGLIAGSTGSGKSVCIHSLIMSLLFKAAPEQVRLLLIDPKMVELAPYNRLPHLVTPVVTEPKQATAALKWAVEEMDKRYEQFAEAGVRDLSRYNDLMARTFPGENRSLPSIVIIIDELADLMMVAPQDVEESICRIAQKARACGIHLLVATQRPSVDVITGLIKANIPSRIAFAVSSQTDSRTILDMGGAERLLGRGDMLYMGSGSSKPVRLQGPYVSDEEIDHVTNYIKDQREPVYLFEREELDVTVGGDGADDLFADAVLFCIDNGQASASSLQRNFRIGYNRAARLIELMEAKGFISGQSGSKPRDVFITLDEFEEIFLK